MAGLRAAEPQKKAEAAIQLFRHSAMSHSSKGRRESKVSEVPVKEGWAQAKAALQALVQACGIATQSMAAEAKALHAALAGCGKADASDRAGVAGADLQAAATLVAKSQRASTVQLQDTAKQLGELAKAAAQAAR